MNEYELNEMSLMMFEREYYQLDIDEMIEVQEAIEDMENKDD